MFAIFLKIQLQVILQWKQLRIYEKLQMGSVFVSGMSAVVTDTKSLSEKETPIYVAIAVILACIVLALFMDSFLVPVFFMLSIGMAIVYNLGSNIFFRRGFLYNKSVSSSITAWCDIRLFYLFMAQL